MRIKLKRLTLVNFKGIRHLDLFMDQVTNIFGDNGTGKTSIFDGFLWLLFGKDSTGREAFEIKTLDENNQPFHKMEHEVGAHFDIDGEEIHLRRTFREKWTTKRGSTEDEWTGHETVFYWNDVPLKESEYKAKIAKLLEESVFRLITNPGYFNSLKWQDRRNILLALAGHISNDEILDKLITVSNKGQYMALINALNAKKTMDEFAREMGAKRKKIKDELLLMPARLDEAKRSLPDEKDYAAIAAEIKTLEESINNIDGLLMNKTQGQQQRQAEKMKLIKRRGELNQELTQIGFSIKNEVQNAKLTRQQEIEEKKRQLRQKQDKSASIVMEIATNGRTIETIKKRQEQLRADYATKSADEIKFNENDFCCPTCKRTFEEGDIEAKKVEMRATFNGNKSRLLASIQLEGKTLGAQLPSLETKTTELLADQAEIDGQIAALGQEITQLQNTHEKLTNQEAEQVKEKLANDQRSKDINWEIAKLNEQINAPDQEDDNSELKQRKMDITYSLDAAKADLNEREQRTKITARIAELEKQNKDMSQELASLEGIEDCIQQFTKAKMDMLEERINGRFQLVKFRMFKDQINGGQAETCDTLINGVPFSDANTASKINAGLDIIKALSDHYAVWAPIFIDNRESVVRIPEPTCQIINLFVIEGAELSVGEIKYKRGYLETKQKSEKEMQQVLFS
jgi:exonuclease SbcC